MRTLHAVIAASAIVLVAHAPLSSQRQWAAPHTPWGDPDLEGIWNFATMTPLERPREITDKEFQTEAQAAEFAKRTLEERFATLSTGDREWWDPGTKVMQTRRTSLISDPPDGHVPALTPEAQKRAAARAAGRRGRGPADSWEDRSLSERCLWFASAGPPMIPGPYNNDIQLLQTRDYVAIVNEMIHDVRLVPLARRPHLAPGVRQWMGDSRGHWEGQSLVIETTNFTDARLFRGAGEHLQLSERLTRTAADTINYEFTASDSTTWGRPWTASFPLMKTQDPVYEFACHEGNYESMIGTLKGARIEEGKK